jgi:hypothetical protein
MFTRQIGEIKHGSNYTSKYESQKKYESIQKLINQNLDLAEKTSPEKNNLFDVSYKEKESMIELDNSELS